MKYSKSDSLKIYSIIVITFIVGYLVFLGFTYGKAKSQNKQIHQITIHTFRGDDVYYVYFATDYTIDSSSNCINFTDGFGIKRKACNNFTLTTY